MKDTKRYPLILLLVLLCTIAKGQTTSEQNIVPMSPTVGSLTQYADCPVSYYSGTPSIDIPLHEINVDNFKLPISLSYYASGIKVAQEASWVGLGWSLNAGGCISRSVQCYDDFLEYQYPGGGVKSGYYAAGDITNSQSSEYYFYVHTSSGIKKQLVIDSEPDIFYYSFSGYSGKFILDKSRGAVLFDKSSGLKITVNTDALKKKYFTVVTPDGTEYVFNTKEVARLYHQDGSLHNNNPNASTWDKNEISYVGSPVVYVSSWFLSKIITTNGREITFTYEKELYKAPAQESCIKYNFLAYSGNTTECALNTSHPYYSTSKAVYDTYRLSRINWDNGYVDFSSSNREDAIQTSYPLRKLDSMKAYDKSGVLVKGVNFGYNYLNNTNTGTYAYVFKRLRLDTVTDVSDANQKYTFSYFPGTLPAKNSKNTDYWGYYNGQNYGSNYYCSTFFNNTYYEGTNKKSSLSHLKAGVLQSIQYPTGGTETYTYEENTYIGSGSTSGNSELQTRSLEVYNKKLIDEYPSLPSTANFTFTLTRTTDVYIDGYMEVVGSNKSDGYNYSSDVVRIRLNGSSAAKFSYTSSELYGKDYLTISRKVTLPAGTYIFEALLAAPDTYVQWSVKYGVVTYPSTATVCKGGGLRIAQIDGGGKQRKFAYTSGVILVDPVTSYQTQINCSNNGAISGTIAYLAQTSESTIPLSSFRNGNHVGYSQVKETVGGASTIYSYSNQQEGQLTEHPFMITNLNFTNGLLRDIQYYQGSTMLKKEVIDHNSTYSQVIKAFKFIPGDASSHSYDYRVEWSSKSKQTTTHKDSRNSLVSEENYVYNAQLFPKSRKMSSDGKWKEERTLYSTDYTDALSNKMAADNYIGIPMERLSLVGGQVVAGHKVSYKDTLNMYLPAVEYTLDAKSPLAENAYSSSYKAQIYYDTYNNRGKLLQKNENGTFVVYLWSYKGEYPVAEIRNATYATVASKLSAQGVNAATLCERQEPTSSDINALKALRTALPQALVTVYTYKPLVGVSSITDSRGVTTYYEYDAAGRLKECYYKEGTAKRVLQFNDYHYTNH